MLLLQEGSTVTWDPVTVCYSSPGPLQTLPALALFAVALYVNWRHVKWMAGRLMAQAGWRATRYWFPTVILAASLVAVLSAEHGYGEADVVFTLVLFFNWPALPGSAAAAGLMAGAGATGTWATGAAILGAWASWYALIRWAERHPDDDALVRLNLT